MGHLAKCVSFSTDSNQSQQEQVKASSAIQEKKSTQFSKSQFTHPIPCRPRLRATPPKTSGNMFEARNRHESSGDNSKLLYDIEHLFTYNLEKTLHNLSSSPRKNSRKVRYQGGVKSSQRKDWTLSVSPNCHARGAVSPEEIH
jgi:hypothetical protein